jgi:hypothetical protein
MNNILDKYSNNIKTIFTIGVVILNGSRSLKRISIDLKFLAINGIVQASKLSNNQGQSLIALSGFLSTLPKQIAPELEDLEKITGQIARKITLCFIEVHRLTQYSSALYKIINGILLKTNTTIKATDINLLKTKELKNIDSNVFLYGVDNTYRQNIKYIANKNLLLLQKINNYFNEIQYLIQTAKKKIDRIRRNGFIANYMGSYISIEASILTKGRKNFEGLVHNIKNMFMVLENSLNTIDDKVSEGDNILSILIKSGITL